MGCKSKPYASLVSVLFCFLGIGVAVSLTFPNDALRAQVDEEPILEPGGPGAATNLQSQVDCSLVERRQGLARLQWTPAQEPGTAQQVVVTVFKDGFETGQFDRSERLPPTQSSLVFEEVQGQALHLWRVLTLQPEGWIPSETARFEGPTCLLDSIEEPPEIE
jgi:hypothetical protein